MIPTRDQARFLAEAVTSARRQDGTPVEIVVVDDGSTDDTAAVLDRLAGDVDVIVRRPHAGVSSARNTGLRASRGEFLVFLDADDRLLPGALRAGAAVLRDRPDCAWTAGRHHRIDELGRRLPDDGQRAEIAVLPAASVRQSLLRGNFVHTAAVMFRREPLERIGGFDPGLHLCEDWQLYLRLSRQHPAVLHEQVVSEYRAHGGQVTVRRTADLLRTGLALLQSQRALLRGGDERAAWRAGRRFWQRHYGNLIVANMKVDLRERRLRAALHGGAVLLRYAPAHLVGSVGRALRCAVGLRRLA